MNKLIDRLYLDNYLDKPDLLNLLNNMNTENEVYLLKRAHETRLKVYGDKVFLRGLIEFTSYCKQNCLYCGLRSANQKAQRYRLSIDEILSVCGQADKLGYKTIVLQGGEDNYYDDEKIIDIITRIKADFPKTAITLSIGEKSYESYKSYFDAGADRYLLRHETATPDFYEKFHFKLNFENRKRCLEDLKKIGYQVGAGFMVGLPGQTKEHLVEDVHFLKELEAHMVGIGPFIPHKDTPLNDKKAGSTNLTLIMLALTRMFLPKVLLPTTTALGTVDGCGYEKGLKAGANVIMPVLTPNNVRNKYALYDGKISIGNKVSENKNYIIEKIENAGFTVSLSRGDNIDWRK
ncbi:iron-only hydrogenase maturation protein HydE [Desulfonispora thiosulfatigenes DSM 11270]|uniref:Iron-only hydrogenase maturation protein HydE n=1 Tax=Desulfonispora thiosulfatigenes DSM 11270 TaxID=656914 RepID=A0A1W1VTW2_DESTI|nr:[FeFe] hydrogenase H-cluster radical SAM maturase HydE [Desulfonispora thiosulfatigenes]SMB96670.1 iron-only hydrogenase maturation protein HydE [Desulfonispora thiosulfatigenes DSM 11270]